MDSGGLYVMICGTYQIPTWPVDSLDILVLSVLTLPQVAGQGERLVIVLGNVLSEGILVRA